MCAELASSLSICFLCAWPRRNESFLMSAFSRSVRLRWVVCRVCRSSRVRGLADAAVGARALAWEVSRVEYRVPKSVMPAR